MKHTPGIPANALAARVNAIYAPTMYALRWIAIVACFRCSLASAQPSPPQTEADRLFEEARLLLEAGRAAEACPKLEASQRLDPARGTLLNIGACYAATGRLVEALAAFRDVEQQSAAANDEARLAEARAQIRRLDGLIPHVVIEPLTQVLELGVEIDGVVVPRESWRDHRRNPGTVRVRAFAPGHEAHFETLTIKPDGATTTIRIPPLASAKTPAVVSPLAPSTLESPTRRKRIAYIVGGSGIAMFGVAAGLGYKAKSDFDRTGCDNAQDPPQCSTVGDDSPFDKNRGAVRLGQIATVIGAAGLVAVGAGVVLYLTAPKTETIVTPTVTPEGAGISVSGSF